METRLEISNDDKRVLLKLSLFSYLSRSIHIEHVANRKDGGYPCLYIVVLETNKGNSPRFHLIHIAVTCTYIRVACSLDTVWRLSSMSFILYTR